MSQIYKSSSTGPPPPTVATTYTTENGNATPSLNVLNVFATDTNIDNDEGIDTIGSGNTVTVRLTNRVRGNITTTNATPTTLISISLGAIPGVYMIEGRLLAYNITDLSGAGYSFAGAARTNGVAGIEISSEDKNIFEEALMAPADFNYGVLGNNVFLEVTGIAGKIIHWEGLFTYSFVS